MRWQPYFGIGYALAVVIGAAGLFVACVLALPSHFYHAYGTLLLGVAVIYLAPMAAIAIHELGHYLAMRLLGHKPKAIYIGAPPKLIKVGRTTPVYLGLVPGGRVQQADFPPPGHAAVILMVGPVADLVTAPLALLLPLPGNVRYAVAVIFALGFTINLLPYRMRTGQLSDGAALLRLPGRTRSEREVRTLLESQDWASQPGAADILLRGYRLEVPAALGRWHQLMHVLRDASRIRDLLLVHHVQLRLPDAPEPQLVQAIHYGEWHAATVPGLPLAEANLASRRMAWVLRHCADADRPAIQHTLAVLRLRQGIMTDVEPLCADGLAAELPPAQRATVLATVAMARHATGLPGREALDEALALDPSADLVAEAVTRLSTPAAKTAGLGRS